MQRWFTTSRITGLLYLGMAISGAYAFLFARSAIYIDGDAASTAINLIDRESLARSGIAAELALVASQALAAAWFFKLFRKTHGFGAGLLATFGMVNAIAILIASAMWLSALEVSLAGGHADTSYVLFSMHNNIWTVASLFFGLWLLPMAYLARRVRMPRALAWFLAAGGVGYILAAFSSILFPEQTTVAELLVLPATVGEFWIIGYLLRGRFHDPETVEA